MKRWKFYYRKMFYMTAGILLASGCRMAAAGAETIRLDPVVTRLQVRRPAGVVKAKKVKISNPERSVVKVRFRKDRNDKRITFTAKRSGSVHVTVTCCMGRGKTKTYHYTVISGTIKKPTAKQKAKKAFRIQNRYRKERNAGSLEWSDELYAFCLYRIRTSGFDRHRNFVRDQAEYFGNFGKYKKLFLMENLYSGSSRAEDAMKGWKGSPGHYTNLMMPGHVCGAVACEKGVWCAVFCDMERTELKGWKDRKILRVTVRRYDSGTGQYRKECAFAYQEEDDSSTLEAAMLTRASGKDVYLEAGKTYVFYERRTPDGCRRAEPVTVTVEEDMDGEIVLKS